MVNPVQAASSVPDTLLQLTILRPLEVRFILGSWVTGAILLLLLLLFIWQGIRHRNLFQKFEIDQAEVGIGTNKLKLLVNDTDRQIAYKIWVELSTRKIGLPIDLEHDVISEVYDSWHTFFTVTRELVKDVPVNKFRRKQTEEIVRMSIGVLNDGLRPHLTKWQARFRRWYGNATEHSDFIDQSPQEIQQNYPKYDELQADLLAVNQRLMAYRKMMYELVVFTRTKKH
ncbi:MAG: hypothetical protein LBE61_03805 [Burkholderiaceae bacterium]|jgi:hypothetical protein|nr:hypothetical protein [Burkholderiaceae bacterium]